jgi:hypothetical protein
METKVTSHIVKGVILSAISIVFAIVVYSFNLYEMTSLNYINYAIFLGGLIYGAILYSNENNNNVTFGNVFAHGFKTTAVIIVITTAYSVVSIKLLFPDMVDKMLELSRKEMLKNPKMTSEMHGIFKKILFAICYWILHYWNRIFRVNWLINWCSSSQEKYQPI